MSGTHGAYPPINGSNHKRPPNSLMRSSHVPPPQPAVNSQHDDLIKYVHEAWDKVFREFHQGNRNGPNSMTVAYYQEREPNPMLKDFQPFDLEAWWGQKVVQNSIAMHQNNGS